MHAPEYSECRLCARSCGVNRNAGERGFCGVTSELRLARAALHMWEEPIISGTRGSGTIFFSGCSLGCAFCQNREISRGESGLSVPDSRLSEIMLELENKGAHNINLVTPTHYVPTIISAIGDARRRGLTLPIVYNTGSYEAVDTVRALDGVVDVYLTDYKFHRENSARVWAKAPNYPQIARDAIAEMVAQRGAPIIEDGIMLRGVIIRILLLPEHLAEAKLAVKYLYEEYGDDVYISLMNQYTPIRGISPPLDRVVTRAEYGELVDYAMKKGVTNAFIQDFGTADESFIPPFDNTGI